MPTAPGYADVSVRLTLAGFSRDAFITFGCNPSATDPTIVAESVKGAWLGAGSMNTKLDQNVLASEFIVRLGIDGTEDIVGTATNTAPGQLSMTSPPPNVALLAHKRTARGGRRGRGRWFIPWFLGEGDIDEAGVVTGATVTALQTVLNTFRTLMATDPGPLVVLHKPGLTTAGAPDVVTNIIVDNKVATQRRRLNR